MNIHKYIKPLELEILIILIGTGIGSYLGYLSSQILIPSASNYNGFKFGWISSFLIVSFYLFKKKKVNTK